MIAKFLAWLAHFFVRDPNVKQPPKSLPVDTPHTLVVLVTPTMLNDMPKSLSVIQNYGGETVRAASGEMYRGNAVFIEGPVADFRTWFAQYDCVWSSTNPVFGSWMLMHTPRHGVDTELIDAYKDYR